MTEKRIKKLNSKVGGNAKSVMTLEAAVDSRPQPLKKLRSSFAMHAAIPGLLPPEAQIVMKALFACFEKAGNVQEGLIGDVMWGFEQVDRPIPRNLTANGLIQLEKLGYLKFQAPDQSFVTFESDKIVSSWVRYQPKLLDMVYEGGGR